MSQFDKVIARTLLLAPSIGKWNCYQNHFREFFANRWDPLNELTNFITDWLRHSVDVLPSIEAYERELTAANDQALLEYVRETVGDSSVPVHQTDAEFTSALRAAKNAQLRSDLLNATRAFELGARDGRANEADLHQRVDELRSQLDAAKQRALSSMGATRSLLVWAPGHATLNAQYEDIKSALEKGDIYYRLPFKALAEAVPVKRGDLVFVGAYTSQGKSLLLRTMAYHFLVEHGRNVAFWSLEMSHDAILSSFALLHANNKGIFPATPPIQVAAYKHGRLTDEQEDFLRTVANRDLAWNRGYGTLAIEEPNKAAFTLADLTERLASIERQWMPVHVLVIDYCTYMYPASTGRYAPVRPDDYNQMIREIKRMCLSYRNCKGEPAPLICLTAAQISRRGYAEAMKQDGLFDLQAFSTYTEIERSADIAMTSLMTPEMRAVGQLQLQVLKNRDGVVPTEPVTLSVDFAHGSRVRELHDRTNNELLGALRSLAI